MLNVVPWLSTLLIRRVFEKGGQQMVAEMERHLPSQPDVVVRRGLRYADGATETTLDLFRPAAVPGPLPVVVWVHGGAWVSGGKQDVAPYLTMLAHDGYAAVGLDYTRGPEAKYPTAVEQLNAALGWIDTHAEELGVDAGRIILAGDSAGAQLASQLAVLITNPRYARLTGLDPALSPEQLRAVILHCGVYDLDAMAKLSGVTAWGFKTSLWAYTGTRAWSQGASGLLMSTISWITPDFPPTFISGGNGDGLTWMQSVPMAHRLSELGVEVTELFFPAGHEPALPHEYQFRLDAPEARTAYAKTLSFLGLVTRPAAAIG